VSLIVQKYGGTSVGTVERIKEVAKRVARVRAQGHDLIVVVSAMSGETNRLLNLGYQVAARPSEREMDALAATGEQVSTALLSIALNDMGVKARSFLGHQVRISTDGVFMKARIKTIEGSNLARALKEGCVAVVAGFQGIDDHGHITTLGRGGSDTTAVAVAAAVRADACEIYTDVDGVYTADPNVVPDARKVDRISFEEMLELASVGAKVLQIRCVEVAMKYNVPLHVRSSFNEAPGTWVVGEDEALEAQVVAGIACDKNEAKVTIRRVPDMPGIVASVFEPLAQANISVDMIIQNVSRDGSTDLTFTVTKTDLAATEDIAQRIVKDIGAGDFVIDASVVKVSIVGLAMRTHAGIAGRMFRILANEGINIQAISTSEIKVSCLIDAKYAELAVRALHDGFGLGQSKGS
jgi:aspartate kinase